MYRSVAFATRAARQLKLQPRSQFVAARSFCAAAPDAAADRPAEDDIVTSFAYFNSLVWFHKNEDTIKWDRIDALKDPKNLVLVAHAFSSAREEVPDLFKKLEERFDDATLAQLDGHYLSNLFYSFGYQSAGSDQFYSRLAARAKVVGLAGSELETAQRGLKLAGKTVDLS